MRCDPYFTKKRQLGPQLPFLGEVGLEQAGREYLGS